MKNKGFPRFTTIFHQKRIEMGLSILEYCVADCVYNLSNNPGSRISGWCYASRSYIAQMLGVAERTIFHNIDKLIDVGFIEKDPETKYIKTTKLWYENIVVFRMGINYVKNSGGMKKLHSTYEIKSMGG